MSDDYTRTTYVLVFTVLVLSWFAFNINSAIWELNFDQCRFDLRGMQFNCQLE